MLPRNFFLHFTIDQSTNARVDTHLPMDIKQRVIRMILIFSETFSPFFKHCLGKYLKPFFMFYYSTKKHIQLLQKRIIFLNKGSRFFSLQNLEREI